MSPTKERLRLDRSAIILVLLSQFCILVICSSISSWAAPQDNAQSLQSQQRPRTQGSGQHVDYNIPLNSRIQLPSQNDALTNHRPPLLVYHNNPPKLTAVSGGQGISFRDPDPLIEGSGNGPLQANSKQHGDKFDDTEGDDDDDDDEDYDYNDHIDTGSGPNEGPVKVPKKPEISSMNNNNNQSKRPNESDSVYHPFRQPPTSSTTTVAMNTVQPMKNVVINNPKVSTTATIQDFNSRLSSSVGGNNLLPTSDAKLAHIPSMTTYHNETLFTETRKKPFTALANNNKTSNDSNVYPTAINITTTTTSRPLLNNHVDPTSVPQPIDLVAAPVRTKYHQTNHSLSSMKPPKGSESSDYDYEEEDADDDDAKDAANFEDNDQDIAHSTDQPATNKTSILNTTTALSTKIPIQTSPRPSTIVNNYTPATKPTLPPSPPYLSSTTPSAQYQNNLPGYDRGTSNLTYPTITVTTIPPPVYTLPKDPTLDYSSAEEEEEDPEEEEEAEDDEDEEEEEEEEAEEEADERDSEEALDKGFQPTGWPPVVVQQRPATQLPSTTSTTSTTTTTTTTKRPTITTTTTTERIETIAPNITSTTTIIKNPTVMGTSTTQATRPTAFRHPPTAMSNSTVSTYRPATARPTNVVVPPPYGKSSQEEDADLTQQIYDKAVEVFHATNKAIHAAVEAVWPPTFEFNANTFEPLIAQPILFMLTLGAAVIVLVLLMMLVVYIVSSQIQPDDRSVDDISIY